MSWKLNKKQNNQLFEESELIRRTNRSNIKWPELVFYAEAAREPFAQVQIITLYSHCQDITEQAVHNYLAYTLGHGNSIFTTDPEVLRKRHSHLYQEMLPITKEREFVEVEPDRVVVAVDVDRINDEAIDKALRLLETIDTFEVGNIYRFGPEKSFEYKEVDEPAEIV